MQSNNFKAEGERIEILTWLMWFGEIRMLRDVYNIEKSRVEFERKKENNQYFNINKNEKE